MSARAALEAAPIDLMLDASVRDPLVVIVGLRGEIIDHIEALDPSGSSCWERQRLRLGFAVLERAAFRLLGGVDP